MPVGDFREQIRKPSTLGRWLSALAIYRLGGDGETRDHLNITKEIRQALDDT